MAVEVKIGTLPDCYKCENGGGFCAKARYAHDGSFEGAGLTGDRWTCPAFVPTLVCRLESLSLRALSLIYAAGLASPPV